MTTLTDAAHLRPLTDDRPNGPAVADPRMSLDVAGFRDRVGATAALLAAHGVKRGDTVGVVLPNRVELVLAMYGAWTLGAALTPVNPILTADEISYQLTDADVQVVVADPAIDLGLSNLDVLTPEQLVSAAAATEPAGLPDASDIALVIYTSGTTGRPKGVLLDHANVDAMTTMLMTANAFTADDRCLLILPLFHANAIMASVVTPLAAGGSSMILEKFERDSFWTSVETYRPTYFSAVPAIYQLLLAMPEDVRPDTSSVRYAICGAAPMPASAITAFEQRYGIPLLEGYGLSESTVALTLNPYDHLRKPYTVGKPLPGVELRIVDDNDDEVPQGADGEVIARGANIMRGYLGKPEETAATLRNGWLHTGDVGHLDDDGYLALVDRKKDLIIRGGENISPSEVEAAIARFPSVLESAVVGRPDAVMGEEPVAFVVARPGETVDAAALLEHLKGILAKFKIPKEIRLVDSIPHNTVGKITKGPLRDLLKG